MRGKQPSKRSLEPNNNSQSEASKKIKTEISNNKEEKLEEEGREEPRMGTKAPARRDSQPKKLVIKNLKSMPKLPDNFESETWNKLQLSVRAIQQNQAVEYSLEELFQAVENLCLHKFSSNLYQNLQQECEVHIQSQVHKLLGQTSESVAYLNLVNQTWQEHIKHMTLIGSIFLTLDRTYVIQNQSVLSIWEMGLYLFKKYVVLVSEVEKKTVAAILDLIERERKGESIDRSLLRHLCGMFVSLQIYADHLEKPLLAATNTFYATEGIVYMRETEVADYLKHVEVRLHEEGERVLHYLDSSTRKS